MLLCRQVQPKPHPNQTFTKGTTMTPEMKTAILDNADYQGRPEGRLNSTEVALMLGQVEQGMATMNGDTAPVTVSARQMSILLAGLVQKDALEAKLQEVVKGFNVIEKNLSVALKADTNEAPFPLSPTQAKVHHAASAGAYQHALEMCNSQSLTAFVENGFQEPKSKAPGLQR
jgi:hypothetical protein